jgi:hypothetical protein
VPAWVGSHPSLGPLAQVDAKGCAVKKRIPTPLCVECVVVVHAFPEETSKEKLNAEGVQRVTVVPEARGGGMSTGFRLSAWGEMRSGTALNWRA